MKTTIRENWQEFEQQLAFDAQSEQQQIACYAFHAGAMTTVNIILAICTQGANDAAINGLTSLIDECEAFVDDVVDEQAEIDAAESSKEGAQSC